MTTILVFGDVHLTTKGEFSGPTQNGLTDYLERVKKSLDFVIDNVRNSAPRAVVFLGDLFETNGYVDTASLKIATHFCDALSAACKNAYATPFFLLGNHDMYSSSHLIHNLEFAKLAGINIVDKPSTCRLTDDVKIGLVPWGSKPTNITDSAKLDLLFTHMDIVGVPYDNGHMPTSGTDLDDIPDRTPVFNGHYHSPSKFGNITNTGALLSRNFHDLGSDPRGVYLIKYVSGKRRFTTTFLPNPYDVRFVDVEITNDNVDVWRKKAENGELLGTDECFVRLRYDKEHQDVADMISALAVDARHEVTQAFKDDAVATSVSEEFSPEKNFERYVDDVFMFDKEGMRERILDLGKAYIEEVQSDRVRHSLPIVFKLLDITGFHSIPHARVNLEEPRLIFVQGANGSGKSSIPESLYWCLTGVSLRGYTGDDVVQWGSDRCAVITHAQIGKQDYRVMRKRPKGLCLEQDDGGEWSDVSKRLMKNTDAVVEELIGRSKEILKHSMFLTSDLQVRFTALNFADRTRLIEQITGLEIYDAIHAAIKTDHSVALKRKAEIDAQITLINTQILSTNERLLFLQGQEIELRKGIEKKLSKLKEALGVALMRQETLTKELADADADLKEFSSAIKDISSEINNIREQTSELSVDMGVKQAEMVRRNSVIAKANGLLDAPSCPTCHQRIDKDTQISVIAEEKKKLRELADELNALERKCSSINSEITEATRDRENLDNKYLDKHTEIVRIKKFLASAEKEAEAVKSEMKEVRTGTRDVKARIAEMKTLLKEQQEVVGKLEYDKETVADLLYAREFLLGAFGISGIRSKMLTATTIPFLNSRVAYYSEKFGFPFKITAKHEAKSGAVSSKIDIALPGERKIYKGCSRGEKRKIDLSVQLAINDLAIASGGGKTNLLVCDEIIDPLDDDSVAAFIEILRERAQTMTVLLMSHKSFLETYCDERWLMTKTDEFSTLEVIDG